MSTREEIKQSQKRQRPDETSDEPPSKRNAEVQKEKSLHVPFWKQLNRRQASNEFRTRSIGSFSILRHDNTKECFEDQRYMRSNDQCVVFHLNFCTFEESF